MTSLPLHVFTDAPQIAKDILPDLLREGGSPRALVQAKGLLQISDSAALEALVQDIIDKHPGQVAEFRAGKEKLKCVSSPRLAGCAHSALQGLLCGPDPEELGRAGQPSFG